MTNITSIQANVSSWVPKEVATTALGVTIASASGVGMQFIWSSLGNCSRLPTIIKNIIHYGGIAGGVAGTVIAVYSMVHLCQKIISEKNELHKAVTATALGVLLTAFAHGIGQHFIDIAPSFDWLMGHSIAYCIGTNLAWQACVVTGFAALVFTAYAAYRTGQAILANVDPVIVENHIPELA